MIAKKPKEEEEKDMNEKMNSTGLKIFDHPEYLKKDNNYKKRKRDTKNVTKQLHSKIFKTHKTRIHEQLLNSRKQKGTARSYSEREVMLMIKDREKELIEKYEKILQEKLQEQYKQFTGYVKENIHKTIDKNKCGYIS